VTRNSPGTAGSASRPSTSVVANGICEPAKTSPVNSFGSSRFGSAPSGTTVPNTNVADDTLATAGSAATSSVRGPPPCCSSVASYAVPRESAYRSEALSVRTAPATSASTTPDMTATARASTTVARHPDRSRQRKR
jgi:hypothetical protein